MTPLPRPDWKDYLLAFVLTVGGIALTTVYLAPILAGGLPMLIDTYRSAR